MSRSLRLTIFFSSMMASFVLQAQYKNLYFRHYNSSSGLTMSEALCVFEDSRHFLWVGSSYGLTRYDGREFRNFISGPDAPERIFDNAISAIQEDGRGFIWLAINRGGLVRMDPFKLEKEKIDCPKSLGDWADLKPQTLVIDEKDRIWVGTAMGLYVYDQVSRVITPLSVFSSLGKNISITKLYRDGQNRIWVGTRKNGLFVRESGKDIFIQVASGKSTGSVNGISFKTGTKGLVATDQGLFSLDKLDFNHPWTINKAGFISMMEPLMDVLQDDKNNIWMATPENGLRIYFPETGFLDVLKESTNTARGLLSNRVYSLYEDSREGIWVSSENGLQGFNGRSQLFNVYPGLNSMSNELRGATIYGIQESGNDLLLATSGGVLVYDRATNQYVPVHFKDDGPPKVIRFRTFTPTSKDQWMVSSDKGMYDLIRDASGYLLRPISWPKYADTLKGMSFRNAILEKGGNIWFGTTDNGLIYLDFQKGKIDIYRHDNVDPGSICDDIIYVLNEDREGNLMIGTENGFSLMNKATHKVRNFIFDTTKGKGLNNRMVADAYDNGEQYLLATQGGGLNKIDKKTGRYSYVTTRDGLCSDAIYTIIPQGDSMFWLGTINGLARLDIRNSRILNFDVNDGMTSNEFNMSSKFVNPRGEVFMATNNGVISFFPQELGKAGLNPDIQLIRVGRNGEYLTDSLASVVNKTRSINYNHGEDIDLEFSPMVFFGNNNYRLKYSLVGTGMRENWREGEKGYLIPLFQIPAGEYKLFVQIFDNTGMRSSPVWSIRINVVPPFWKTTSFLLLVFFLSGLALIILVVSYFRRRLRTQEIKYSQQQLIERERTRISADLHDDIGGGLTAIRLMSEMIKEKDNNSPQQDILLKISDTSNELVQKMNEIVWALNSSQDDLPSLIAYIRRFAVSYLDDMGIRTSVTIPDTIPDMKVSGLNRRNIFLIVKEALNNLVKHSEAGNAEITISLDSELRIIIRDDGIGFQTSVGKPLGNGLRNMSSRAEKFDGHVEISGEKGTTVTFGIPLVKLNP